MIHTLQQVRNMSQEELRTVAAKLDGWNAVRLFNGKYGITHHGNFVHKFYEYNTPEDIFKNPVIPDYPHNSSVMTELELSIPNIEKKFYGKCLLEIMHLGRTDAGMLLDVMHLNSDTRCRAWILWKENTKWISKIPRKK